MEINLKCPECGQSEKFAIRNFASVRLAVAGDGEVLDVEEVEPEWDCEDLCDCEKCGYSGCLLEFNEARQD